MNRRHFFGSAVAAGIASHSRAVASPNDTVRVACVGFRNRGRDHIRAYSEMKNVEISALCDIDESILNGQLAAIEKSTGRRPVAYTDLRRLLEDKTIDAVSIATPNHNHTLQTIWACQAGKDVYVALLGATLCAVITEIALITRRWRSAGEGRFAQLALGLVR